LAPDLVKGSMTIRSSTSLLALVALAFPLALAACGGGTTK